MVSPSCPFWPVGYILSVLDLGSNEACGGRYSPRGGKCNLTRKILTVEVPTQYVRLYGMGRTTGLWTLNSFELWES